MAAAFYSSPVMIDEKPGVSLQFIDKLISQVIFKRFRKVCLENMEFGEITSEKLKGLLAKAHLCLLDSPIIASPADERPAECSLKREGLDIFQAQSIRRHTICQYNISNAWRITQDLDKLAGDYASGAPLLEISRRAVLSPFAIFRGIMSRKIQGAKEKLSLLSLGKVRPEDVLDERDAKEFRIAQDYDYESVAVQMKMAKGANMREDNFVRFLRDDLGIKLKTQSELYEEAMKSGKKPVTPDVLFESPVIIYGERARWIDFKSYCGAPIPYLLRSTVEQAKKYEKTFGPGFIVYEHGLVAGLPYPAISARGLRDIIDKGTLGEILV